MVKSCMNQVSVSRAPLYLQVKLALLDALEAGEWLQDDMLPSEFELADRFGVSQGTVRKALDDLVIEQVLSRRQGKGTFVARYPDEWQRVGFVLQGDFAVRDFEPVQLELLSCARANASEGVAAALQLRRGASIVQVRRLLRIRDQAVALEDVVLSLELFEGLDARKIKQCGGALYELYHRVFGVRVVTTRERSRAVLADRDDARLLDVEHAAPLLEVVRVAYASADKPVEWRKVICRNDVYSYTNRL
jgi:GntR family transcriptional regulator